MGWGSHLGISIQDSYGTANTGSYMWHGIVNESISEAIPILESETIRGRFEAGPAYQGPHEITGDISGAMHPILIGQILHAWCGISSGTLGTSEYTHEFKPKTSDHSALAAVPPLTIQAYRDAGSAHQYYDCLAEGLTIEIANGAIIQNTLSVIGGQFSKVAKSTPSYYSGSDFTWDQASIQIAGSAIDEILDMTITFTNNLQGWHTLDGNKTPNRIKRSGFRMVEISGTLLFENDTEFDAFRNSTERRWLITITGGECSSGYNNELIIDLPSIRYTELPVQIGGIGLVEASFTGSARYNEGSGTMVEITLVNTMPGYGDY